MHKLHNLSWMLFALCVFALTAPVRAQPPSSSADASSFFVVTRPDLRRCAYPLCGGYFVRLVNQARTRCADGTLQADCHVVDFDFSASGLSEEDASVFENELLVTGKALVRGKLTGRDVGSTIAADTLAISEAWAGQAQVIPQATFFRLSDTGVRCITSPCPSYLGQVLNTSAKQPFNRVDFSSSGAPEQAMEEAYAALAAGHVLAAGKARKVQGPAGFGNDFVASEFYLRVTSRDGCAPQAAAGVGACDRFFGYAWDGAACTGISGCSCEGPDCDALYASLEACQNAHAACSGALCGSQGLPVCADDQYCDYRPAVMCGVGNQPGVCLPRPQICPLVYLPVCGCDGKTYANSCAAAAAGTDAAYEGKCQ